MRKNPTALAMGALRWENAAGSLTLGGNATVFACRVAELGHPSQLAACIGGDELGDRAIDLLSSFGVGLSLVQRDSLGITDRVDCALLAESAPSYHRLISDSSLSMRPTSELLVSSDNADILYINSSSQGASASSATFRHVLENAGPSFKIYDIDCGEGFPTREDLDAGLTVASVVHARGRDIPVLCDLLGLPHLEPGLFAPAITERFGASYCVVADPFEGALISSIAGEQVGLDRVRESTFDIRGWHEAFLAGFAHHVFRGSSLSFCCAAAMRYGDSVALSGGAVERVAAEALSIIKAVDA